MRSHRGIALVPMVALTLVGWAAAVVVAGTPGSAGDTTADRVIGQVDFTKVTPDMVDPVGLSGSIGIAWDASSSPHHLYVADTENARVLGWKDASSLANGAPADLVIGQPDFLSGDCYDGSAAGDIGGVGPDSLCSPIGLAVDPQGNLFVADGWDNRVLEYAAPFAACQSFPCVGAPANLVIGQNDFVSRIGGDGSPDQWSLSEPFGVAVDRLGNLYVADSDENRVLEYDAPLSTGQAATRVFGQPDFVSNGTSSRVPKDAPNPGPDSLSSPTGVTVDQAGNLWVADLGNNRVLEYDAPLASGVKCTPHSDGSGCAGDTIADHVYGEGDFISGSGPPQSNCGPQEPPPPVNPTVSASSLCAPMAVAVDLAGHLYVADYSNNRILEYDQPLASFTTEARRVFGQSGSFGASMCGAPGSGRMSADSLCEPSGLAVDSTGHLFASDLVRVVEYLNPLAASGGRPGVPGFAGDTTADRVLGQVSFGTGYANFVDARALGRSLLPFAPYSLSPASQAYQGLASQAMGGAVALDVNSTPNHLYVADAGNNRVLGWLDSATFANGAAADLVIGQPGFYSTDCNGSGNPSKASNPSATSLCAPTGLTVDSSSNLWVADTSNNRVLKYNPPFKSSKKAAISASLVLGTCAGGFGASQCRSAHKDSLSFPSGVAVDAKGHVYVADTGNDRVLEYDNPRSGAIDPAATRVFGQNGSFTATGCAFFTSPSSFTGADLCAPRGVAVDPAGNLYVADIPNTDAYGRVLEYDNPTAPATSHSAVSGFAGDTIPDRVFGEPDINTISFNFAQTPGPDTLLAAVGVAVDAGGNVYISDLSNNRVLEYDNPLAPGGGTPGVPGSAGDTTADRVFGQSGDFTTRICAHLNFNFSPALGTPPGPDTLCTPSSVAVDAAGNLYIFDFGDSRVLEYDKPVLDPVEMLR